MPEQAREASGKTTHATSEDTHDMKNDNHHDTHDNPPDTTERGNTPSQSASTHTPKQDQPDQPDQLDDFGLPIRKRPQRSYTQHSQLSNDHQDATTDQPITTASSEPSHPPVVQADKEATNLSAALVQDEAQNAVIASREDGPPRGEAGPSAWSHQHIATDSKDNNKVHDDDDDWQEMPAYATHVVYDDWGKVIAREMAELEEEDHAYGQLGGAGKGYTKVQLDDDVQSATSMDEDTAYLFNSEAAAANTLADEDEGRDILSQMQATKDLLTEGQRIAYVGLVRLSIMTMIKDLDKLERTKSVKKFLDTATESMQMWSQKMMVRLYSHMDIDPAEQIMIEQLADHGVEPGDLTPTLMQNARVKNPVTQTDSAKQSTTSLPSPSMTKPNDASSQPSSATAPSSPPLSSSSVPPTPGLPPPYEEDNPPDYLTLKDPKELADSKNIDLDLRWTVLCDLFLVLIADSVYDARSRTLLELVGSALSIPWLDICRFEKRVTDALEMQEAADKENWNEDDHMEQRKKAARNRRLVMMGLATVGGGLVIGLSAGLLAPVIGAGLAAGFTTIGVAGTSGFLAGAGGAAVITSIGVTTGGTIAVRATDRRTGAVKTFEYRPLYNNKRVNLIVTVAGWMTGKVDDVRLPFSTVDPIMGDMYSVFWEPEMLRSMGDTINILATEVISRAPSNSNLKTDRALGIDSRTATDSRQHNPDRPYVRYAASSSFDQAFISNR